MRNTLLYSFLFFFTTSLLMAQEDPLSTNKEVVSPRSDPSSFNPEWEPFYHGVASGDPLEDRVIIWTRVTDSSAIISGEAVDVEWQIATDINMENIVQSGVFQTDLYRDYTVKVDVTGLSAGETYYYVFSTGEGEAKRYSLIGRTKTTPSGNEIIHLRFGVVSCSNYQAGYFNAYQHLSRRNDLDAVLHLGDYIYEYADGGYGDNDLFEERTLEPETEILTLEDYRIRYSTYRLDTNLIRVHQQHPFITVWDDHESANDAFQDGAQNHSPETEGNWQDRKAVSKQAYFEWLPIRDQETRSVYRKISYGNFVDLIMLDTRLEGREKQIQDATSPDLQDANRTILGEPQKTWFFQQLVESGAKWKVIGQQVIFSEFHIGWAAPFNPAVGGFYEAESIFLDIWDGYPAERSEVISFIQSNEIDNIVFLTGDFHSSFAFDVTEKPVDLNFEDDAPRYTVDTSVYNPTSGAGSIAVEFATPSVTSANFDENITAPVANIFQGMINSDPFPFGNWGNPNPHMKYADLIQHGYFILDLRPEKAQADWFHSDIKTIGAEDTFSQAWFTLDGENHLQPSEDPSDGKAAQDQPAPLDPPSFTVSSLNIQPSKFALLGIYPNPFKNQNTVHYALRQAAKIRISLLNMEGQLVKELLDKVMPAGIFSFQTDAQGLLPGTYLYQIEVGDQVFTSKVILID